MQEPDTHEHAQIKSFIRQVKAEHHFAFIQFSSRAEAVAALDHPEPYAAESF